MKQVVRYVAIAALGLLLLPFCRGHGDDDSNSTSEVIGPDGGALSLGHVDLTIPRDTLDHDQEISITLTTDVPAGNLGPAHRLQPEDVTFDPPVRIAFSYNDGMLAGSSPSNLSMARATDGRWIPIESMVNVETQEVVANLDHFSTYGIIDTTGGGDGDGDVDSDGDGDGDSDSDGDVGCTGTHATCEDVSYGCTCEWTCPDDGTYLVYCDLGEAWGCDCDGDSEIDCSLDDVGMNSDACGDYTCCPINNGGFHY